jgi:thymidylate synthase (FAD)
MIEILDVLGTDLTVVNAARVSMDKWHNTFEIGNDNRLIKYLARNQHWTPFSQPQIQMSVTVPIFVARQWMSTRYD